MPYSFKDAADLDQQRAAQALGSGSLANLDVAITSEGRETGRAAAHLANNVYLYSYAADTEAVNQTFFGQEGMVNVMLSFDRMPGQTAAPDAKLYVVFDNDFPSDPEYYGFILKEGERILLPNPAWTGQYRFHLPLLGIDTVHMVAVSYAMAWSHS